MVYADREYPHFIILAMKTKGVELATMNMLTAADQEGSLEYLLKKKIYLKATERERERCVYKTK